MPRDHLVNLQEQEFLDAKHEAAHGLPSNIPRKAAMTTRRSPKKSPRARRTPSTATELKTGSLAPAGDPFGSLEAQIGLEVRRLRKSLGLTVAELAAATGISTGMLSKIENGGISPSLGTLRALAQALNVPISHLFREEDERRDCSYVKRGTGVRIERRGTKAGHLYDLLGHSLAGDVSVEPYLITLRRDAAPYPNFSHAGLEFIYMLSGSVQYRHADRLYLLEPGDALFFDAAARHGPEVLVQSPMQYLSIIIYPRAK